MYNYRYKNTRNWEEAKKNFNIALSLYVAKNQQNYILTLGLATFRHINQLWSLQLTLLMLGAFCIRWIDSVIVTLWVYAW